MKRTILTALVAVGAGMSGLMAQQQPAQAQKAEPKAKSQAELKVLQAMFAAAQAQNNDTVIASADELLTKYADTEFKELALTLEAAAYEQKGDWAKEQIFLEQVLAINPKSPDARFKLADILVKHTHENDLDKDDKLARAEKLLNGGLEDLKTYEKPNAQIPDATWEQNKKYLKAQAEDTLGLASLVRKKWDDAATHFQAAIESDPQAAYQAQLASAYQDGGKNDEAIAVCDKLLADPQLHPAIKAYTQKVKAAATKAKGAAGK